RVFFSEARRPWKTVEVPPRHDRRMLCARGRPSVLHSTSDRRRHFIGIVHDAPDSSMLGIGDVQRSVGTFSETGGPESCTTRSVDRLWARESVSKHFPIARGLSVLHRNENNLVALLFVAKPIPASMKGDERAVAVFFREH